MMNTPNENIPAVYDNVSFGLIVTDPGLAIRLWNRGASRVYGATAQEMIGKPLLDIVPADHRALALRHFRAAVLQKKSSEFEVPHCGPKGESQFLAITISPLLDDAGNCTGLCADVRDISRRVALEKQVVTHRTMAALGTLSGSVAHHFNNLLGGIATSVDFALATSEPAAIRRALQFTAESVARAAKITQSLLAFAEGDTQWDEREEFDTVVRRYLDERRAELDERHIHLILEQQAIPILPVPVRRVRTMLSHLIDNAVEAMPNGGELRVKLFPKNRTIRLALIDTGMGVSRDQLERLFEPFFTTKHALGSEHIGLGLAVVHGIVRELNGTANVDSDLGKGTHIEIRLPFPGSS